MLFHERYGYFDKVNTGYVMNIQYRFRRLKITYRSSSRLVVITIRCFRNFGDVECENISQQFYTTTFTLFTLTNDETTNSPTGAPYVLTESMLPVSAVTLLKVMFVTTVAKKKKKNQPSIIAKSALVRVKFYHQT